MSLAGIIAEFNPLHNGHKYLIDAAKNDGFDVACVISGNFVQRGDTALLPKFERAKSALYAGVDIVLELPVPWSMSTAQNFALGGISQLSSIGVDTLYFGSECADTTELVNIAEILLSESFNQILSSRLKGNETFAKLRRDTVCEILGKETSVLDNPNDTLAVEYICTSIKLGAGFKFKAIKRQGASHNDSTESRGFSTSTLLRKAAQDNNINYLRQFMPEESFKILINSPISSISRLDTAIVSRIKQLREEELSNLPDISEGIERHLYKTIANVYTYSDICDAIKSKRYTMARVRRLVLSAFLGIDNSYFQKEPPYVRVLGFNDNACKYLSGNGIKPIITKVSQINMLNEFSKKVFETENRINKIYALSLDNPSEFIDECSQKIITI